MDGRNQSDLDGNLEQLTAYAAPIRLPVGSSGDREQRSWVVRFTSSLPADLDPVELSRELARAAVAMVREALAERGLPVDGEQGMVGVKLLPFGDQYAVIVITTIRLERDEAEAYLVAASAVLTALDRIAKLADIQGIPRRYWRMLIGP